MVLETLKTRASSRCFETSLITQRSSVTALKTDVLICTSRLSALRIVVTGMLDMQQEVFNQLYSSSYPQHRELLDHPLHLNDILYVGLMKGLWLFASLSAAAAGCVTLPFALSEVAYDIRYMCVCACVCLCLCGFENEMNYLTSVTLLQKFVSHYYCEH